ncbi:prolyl oligopeptidase family serine peptidase [Salinicoccus sesuvii]|uniref:Prolyl oligopeptidase family serine peptidase n=1 Tax=Salinicoccus sesuvii TaxID=868281 RepID=A0ABV7N4A0_9STAP
MAQKADIKNIFKIRSVSSPKVASDHQFTTLVTHLDEEKNDYITNLYRVQDESLQQLTYQKERLSNVRHSEDGQWTLFIAKAEDKPQVFLLRATGGERMQLTKEKWGVNSAEFSKDGKKVFYHVSVEKGADENADETSEKDKQPEPVVIDRMKYKADSVGLLKEKYQAVKFVELDTKESETLLDGDENFTLHETIGSDTLIYSTDKSEDPDFNFNETLYIRKDGDEPKEVPAEAGGFMKVSASPDEKRLLIVEMSREYENATHGELHLYDIDSGEKTHITEGLDKPVGDYLAADTQQSVESNPVAWISNDRFVFLVSDNGSVNLYEGNTEGTIKPLLEGRQHIFGMDATHEYAVLAISKHTSPSELYRYDFESGSLEQLTQVNQAYTDETELVDPEDITFSSEDGTEVRGWFMKPAGFETGAKYPMITNIHGGPHAFYGNSFFHEMQVLAAKGYAVLFVNPRGSHSYSQAFVDAVRGDYGGGDYRDIMAGVDYVTGVYDWIDQDNLGVTGGSYGGFMTNWIVGHTDRFKAAVTQRSICNWVSFRGVSDIGYYFTDWQIQAEFSDIEKMWHHSPIKYVDAISTPLLILHSERDFRCPIEQAEQLYIALKYQKKETQFVRFPEADHNLSRTGKPNLRIERLTHLVDWFEKYLD